MTVMDLDTLEMADQQALRLLRLELRAMADDIMAAMRAMPMPKTWLDAGRTLRALATTDRTLTQLYLPPRRGRARPARPRVADTPLPENPGPENPGGNAPAETSPRPVAESTSLAAKPQAPHGLDGRPAKGTRDRLKHSASTFATAVPGSPARWPMQGKGTAPFTAASPPLFRPGKPEVP